VGELSAPVAVVMVVVALLLVKPADGAAVAPPQIRVWDQFVPCACPIGQ
jgi:hypothetical protein